MVRCWDLNAPWHVQIVTIYAEYMPNICGGWDLQWLMSPGASLWWACLLPRVIKFYFRVHKLMMATWGPKHVVVVNSSPSMLYNETFSCVYDCPSHPFLHCSRHTTGMSHLKKSPLSWQINTWYWRNTVNKVC